MKQSKSKKKVNYSQELLKKAMKEKKMKIVDLADQIGASKDTVKRWRTANCTPSNYFLEKLNEVLDLNLNIVGQDGVFDSVTFKRVCKESGLPILQIAKKSGVPFSTIRPWYYGNVSNPNKYSLKRVAKVLGVSLDAFYKTSTEIKPEISEPFKVEEIQPDCIPISESYLSERPVSNSESETMPYRKLISELDRCEITIPEFAYEIGFSKSDMEEWEKDPKVLSENQKSQIKDLLKLDSLQPTPEEKEIEEKFMKMLEDFSWTYQEMERLLNVLEEIQ